MEREDQLALLLRTQEEERHAREESDSAAVERSAMEREDELAHWHRRGPLKVTPEQVEAMCVLSYISGRHFGSNFWPDTHNVNDVHTERELFRRFAEEACRALPDNLPNTDSGVGDDDCMGAEDETDSDAPTAASQLMEDEASDDSDAAETSSVGSSHSSAKASEAKEAQEEEDDEVFSDVSSDSDLFHISAEHSPKERTIEDVDLGHIARIKGMLRKYPLLPPKPGDSTADFMDVDSGVKFPVVHCAFFGCCWTKDLEERKMTTIDHRSLENCLIQHLKDVHREQLALPDTLWPSTQRGDWDMLAYYTAAVCEREREHMPIIGPSVDRRSLRMLHAVCNSKTVCSLSCFCCAQVRTRAQIWENTNASDIQLRKIAHSLYAFMSKAPEEFERACSYAWYVQEYGTEEEQRLGAANVSA